MKQTDEGDNPCTIKGIRITMEQCRRRQLGNWRYSKGRNGRSKPMLNPMFVSCRWNLPNQKFCPWWISDTEYFEHTTAQRQFTWQATAEQLEEMILDV